MENDISVQNKIFGKTFFWMFLGLLGTAIIAWYTYSSGLFINIIWGNSFGILLIVELVAVLLFSFSMIYFITLSTIFVVFELSSIVYLFVISAIIFAVLAFIGYRTQKDLSSWGPYITVFLIAGIVLSFINLFFLKSSTLDLAIDWLILILFFGVTVYDIRKIKDFQAQQDFYPDKIHIYCAMQLYLDFINIFLRILSIFGKRRD